MSFYTDYSWLLLYKLNAFSDNIFQKNLSNKELEEITGIKASTLKTTASNGKITDIILKPIKLYIENQELKEKIHATEQVKTALRAIMK